MAVPWVRFGGRGSDDLQQKKRRSMSSHYFFLSKIYPFLPRLPTLALYSAAQCSAGPKTTTNKNNNPTYVYVHCTSSLLSQCTGWPLPCHASEDLSMPFLFLIWPKLVVYVYVCYSIHLHYCHNVQAGLAVRISTI